jgi:hypothetical protein
MTCRIISPCLWILGISAASPRLPCLKHATCHKLSTSVSGHPRVVVWIDFWAVEPCSNAETDYARGLKYAEEAVSHVHPTRPPAFIECVLIFIGIKLCERNQLAGGWKMVLRIAFQKRFPVTERYSGASLHGAQGGQGQRTCRFTNAETQTSGATHLVNRTR